MNVSADQIKNHDVAAIIVTYNPKLARFRNVLNSAANQVKHVVIVDNGSVNNHLIKSLCEELHNCIFIEVGSNSGIAHALKIGVQTVSKYNPEWILLLDDDTILLNNALNKAVDIINSLPSRVIQRIGAVLLGSSGFTCKVRECRYGVFSGTLIRTEIALRACCRDDFFLDQADHDMYSRIRGLGLITLIIECKLVDHKLGRQMWIPIISHRLHKPVSYEPPWRYYYIVRNSTRLLVEGKMDVVFYINQLIYWGIRILLKDGIRAFIKPLALGLVHGLVNSLGYLNPEVFKNSSS
jgi:rhamnosyltransferase